jgi:hypothetical protein
VAEIVRRVLADIEAEGRLCLDPDHAEAAPSLSLPRTRGRVGVGV